METSSAAGGGAGCAGESGGARLRRLHALLCKEDVDAAAIILGIDAQHSPACLAAACYLVPSLAATLRDTALLDDCVFVIHTHPHLQLHAIAPPGACPTILAHCRDLPGFRLHASVASASRFLATQEEAPGQPRQQQQQQQQHQQRRKESAAQPEADEEEEEAIELYKVLTFVDLMRDKQRVALPLDGNQPATVEGWPLVQATALEHFGAGGFFTLVHNVVDLSQILDPLQCALDAEACRALAAAHLPSFTAAWSAAATAFRSSSAGHNSNSNHNNAVALAVDSEALQAVFQEHFPASTRRPGPSKYNAHHGAHGAHDKLAPIPMCECDTKALFARQARGSGGGSVSIAATGADKPPHEPFQHRGPTAAAQAAQDPTAVRIAVQLPGTPLRCTRTWVAPGGHHSGGGGGAAAAAAAAATATATIAQILRFTAHIFERDAHDIAHMAILRDRPHCKGRGGRSGGSGGGVGDHLTMELRAAFPGVDMDPARVTTVPLSAEGMPHPCTHGATAPDTMDVALLPTEAAVHVEVVLPRIAIRCGTDTQGDGERAWEARDLVFGDTFGIAHCTAAQDSSDGGKKENSTSTSTSITTAATNIVRADVLTRGVAACCVRVCGEHNSSARSAQQRQQQGGKQKRMVGEEDGANQTGSPRPISASRGGVLRIGGFSLAFPGEATAPSPPPHTDRQRPGSSRRVASGRANTRDVEARLLLADGGMERGVRVCFEEDALTLHAPLPTTSAPVRLAVTAAKETHGRGQSDVSTDSEKDNGTQSTECITAAWMGKTRDHFVLALGVAPQPRPVEKEEQAAAADAGHNDAGMMWLRANAWPSQLARSMDETKELGRNVTDTDDDDGSKSRESRSGGCGAGGMIWIVLADDVHSTLHHTISRQVLSSWKAIVPFRALSAVPTPVTRALAINDLAERHALRPSFLTWKDLCDVLRGALISVKELRLLAEAAGITDAADVIPPPPPPSSSSLAVRAEGVAARAVVDVCVVLVAASTLHARLARVLQAVTDHSPGVVIADCSMYASTASHISAIALSLVSTVARHLTTDRPSSTSTSTSSGSGSSGSSSGSGGVDDDEHVAGAQAIVALHTHMAPQQVVAVLQAATTARVRINIAAVVCAATALDLWPAPREFEMRPPLSPQLHSAHCTHCLVAPTPKAATHADGTHQEALSTESSLQSKRLWVTAEDASAALRMYCPTTTVVRLSDVGAAMDALLDCLDTRPYAHAARVLLRRKTNTAAVDVLAKGREAPLDGDDSGAHTFVVENATAAVVQVMADSLRAFALPDASGDTEDNNVVVQLYHSDGRSVISAVCVPAWRAHHTTTTPMPHHPHAIAAHSADCVCFATVCSVGQCTSQQHATSIVKRALLGPIHDPSSSSLGADVEVTTQQREKLNSELSGQELPEGWYYTGHQYVSMEGHRQAEHPLLDQRVEQWRAEEEEKRAQVLSQLKAVKVSAHEASAIQVQSPPASGAGSKDVGATTPSPRPPKTPPPSSSASGRRHLLQPRPPTGRVRGRRRASQHGRTLPSVQSSSKQPSKAATPPTLSSSASSSTSSASQAATANTPTPPTPPTGAGGARARKSSASRTRRLPSRGGGSGRP